jgi:hypothetical protein
MEPTMLTDTREHHQVLDPVVGLVMVDVVDHLAPQQGAVKDLQFCNQSVLVDVASPTVKGGASDISVGRENSNVSRGVDETPTLPPEALFTGCSGVGCSGDVFGAAVTRRVRGAAENLIAAFTETLAERKPLSAAALATSRRSRQIAVTNVTGGAHLAARIWPHLAAPLARPHGSSHKLILHPLGKPT